MTIWELSYEACSNGRCAEKKTRSVIKYVDHVNERVAHIERYLNRTYDDFHSEHQELSYWRTVSEWVVKGIALFVGTLLVIYTVPRLFILLKVWFSDANLTFEEFEEGYEFWYGVTRPWESLKDRRRNIHVAYTHRYRDK